MGDAYTMARNLVLTMLLNENIVTDEMITAGIDKVKLMISDLDTGALTTDLIAHYGIISQDYSILEDQSTQQPPWLDLARPGLEWKFWSRYRQYLQLDRRIPTNTVSQLSELTDDILDRLADPKAGKPFDRRGMVVGQVQSGKTANYSGLICKAADAGYRIIIVLAGIHSSLRSQTQQRLDEGFLGFDTQTQRNFARANHWIGVGKRNRSVPASSLTSSALNGDFTRTAANASGVNIHGSDPVLIVIKKNVSILKNLITWLAGKSETLPDGRKLLRGLPLLLIDDEADNASINVSKDNISATNAAIRVLLSLFEQRAYVGYTATPFANVFIPLLKEADYKALGLNINAFDYAVGQELFPRDFIVNIPPPSNYVGPNRIFGIGEPEEEDNDSHERTLPVLRIIDDYLEQIPDKHRKDDDLPAELPGSLKEAVLAFLLSCASRFARGQVKQHSSMLIHVSRFVLWQNHIGYLVNDYFEECRAALLLKNSLTEQYLKELWEDDYLPSTNEVIDRRLVDDPLLVPLTWEQVQPQLHAVAQRIKVRVVHGTPDKTGSQLHKPLDYIEFDGTGLLVIAIGGNKLSRGLTLEGLCVSYYLRASRMYDTLMQMGRWFGYRPGYADLCRLYTSEELVSWYRHVTMATEELRLEFDRMVRLRRAPKEYGLKIRVLL